MILVLMGVSGAGKTTIGTLVAARAGIEFADGDDYHPRSNKEKMAAGIALTDADRQPWLETLNALLLEWFKATKSGVLACSALKEHYRETLRKDFPAETVRFCLLQTPRGFLAGRLESRKHEFMTPALLDSQLATLVPPHDAWIVENDRPAEEVAAEILGRIVEH
jgi:gluconokinase